MSFAFSILIALMLAGADPQQAAPAPDTTSGLTGKWGIDVAWLRLTAGDHMIDFRYKVLDAAKAAPLHLRKIHPELVVDATGVRIPVATPAKIGALRTSHPPQEGRTYFMMFPNVRGSLKRGDKISVVIGDFKAAALTLE